MDHLDEAEKATISDIDAALKRLNKSWAIAKRSCKEWDFKTSEQTLEALSAELEGLGNRWQEHEKIIRQVIELDQEFVESDDYPKEVETVLSELGIPLRGEFPNYEFPPFKLSFNRDQGVVRLSIGRRSQQTKAFAPEQLGAWVSSQYRKVIDSKFDANRFCKELLSAYELLNCLMLKQDQVNWGHSVPLKEIYRLLTFKQSAKQDYPEALFVFDLARLKEQPEIQYDRYQFDLEPSRNQASSFLLVNREGQESRVSTLAIHLLE
jgi:hypothetical protein